MKSIIKKTLFMLIILIILFSINTKVFAWSQIIEDGKQFIKHGETIINEDNNNDNKILDIDANKVKEVSGYLYNILLAAGVVIAVIVATVLGIQFMIGGAEGQAKVKEMLIPFVAGCIIVFGGFGFWKLAVTIGDKLDNVGQTSTEATTEERN